VHSLSKLQPAAGHCNITSCSHNLPVAAPGQVLLEEGGRHIPVTIRGLSPNGYLLVRRLLLTICFLNADVLSPPCLSAPTATSW